MEASMFIAVPLVVALIGLFMFFFCANPKWSEVGKIMLWTGLLAFLLKLPAVLPTFHITG
jgi:Na+/phosphate symporter